MAIPSWLMPFSQGLGGIATGFQEGMERADRAAQFNRQAKKQEEAAKAAADYRGKVLDQKTADATATKQFRTDVLKAKETHDRATEDTAKKRTGISAHRARTAKEALELKKRNIELYGVDDPYKAAQLRQGSAGLDLKTREAVAQPYRAQLAELGRRRTALMNAKVKAQQEFRKRDIPAIDAELGTLDSQERELNATLRNIMLTPAAGGAGPKGKRAPAPQPLQEDDLDSLIDAAIDEDL